MKIPRVKKCVRCNKRRRWKNLYCKSCFRMLSQRGNN